MAAKGRGERSLLAGKILSGICVGVLLAQAAASLAVWTAYDWQWPFDDAYISYRYAWNLAHGHGLAWNPGEGPVEGFTNLLLVLLLAPTIALGLDPHLVARVLNDAAVVAIGLLLWRAGTRACGSRLSGLLPAVIFWLRPETARIATLGLESMLFAAALLYAVDIYAGAVRTQSTRALYGSCTLFTATCLLRPDGAVFYGLCLVHAFGWGFAGRRWALLRPLLLGALGPALAIAAFKLVYFGSLLPEPFHVKLSGEGVLSSLGLGSVTAFFTNHAAVLLLASLAFAWRGRTGETLPGLMWVLVLAYLLFFLRVDTLMDVYGRFLAPLFPLLLWSVAPLLSAAMRRLMRDPRRWALAPLILPVIALTTSGTSIDDIRVVLRAVRQGSLPTLRGENLMVAERRFAERLAAVDGIAQRSIALHDCGVIPYFTHARTLDLVGLNDRRIARERSLPVLLDVFYDVDPDIVLVPTVTTPPGSVTVLTNAHGVLGRNLPTVVHDPRWSRYLYAGTVDTSSYGLAIYVNRHARDADRLRDSLLDLADRQDRDPAAGPSPAR